MKTADNFIKITVERLFRVNGTSAQQYGRYSGYFSAGFQ